MKKYVVPLLLSILVFSCTQEPKKGEFPKTLVKVFEKHGGIEKWRKANTLSFNIKDEAHTVDLRSRKTVIHSPTYSLGHDGKELWTAIEDTTAFKKDPGFYYNLNFYFYAMPFVLADDGIIYEKADPLQFEGKKYPGFKISYEENIGETPDDIYFVYYDATTYQMAWLQYTVTYYTKEPTDNLKTIRYHDWETVDGFLLPKAITWYDQGENGQPTTAKAKTREFSLAIVNEAQLKDSFFEKPVEE